MARKKWPKGTWMKLSNPDTLRVLMKDRGVSQERLARYAGCSKSFISHLTSGRKGSCSAELAARISESLNLPTEVLFVPGDSTDGRSFPKYKGRRAA